METSPAFFWLWNAPLDAAALCAQLEDMRSHGLRGVCIHPFPKGFRPATCPSAMEPDYLTPEFLDVFAAVVRRAGELGMHAYLYDEGGWPSGGACGLVAASDPEGRFAPRERTSADGPPRARPYGAAPARPSVVEPGATQRFLDLTHEACAARLGGALGTTVQIAFTDEPGLPRDDPRRSLAWASDFDAEFRRRKGYDAAPFVPALLADADGANPALGRVRVDIQDVKSDLFVERYLAPLRDWCRAHGLLSGGHLNAEDAPEAGERTGHGSLPRSLRAMDVPGVDVIWRQLFPGAPVNPFPRYAASAAHQNGGRFALSESFGIFGDSLSPAERKWVVDCQLVRGVNLFVFAYYAQSNARHWMTLLEPHAGPVDPTWDFAPHFFRYVERTSRFLSRGRPGAETAVLLNVRAFWAGAADRDAAAAAHYAAARALDEANVDYDFVEDRDLASAKVLPDGRLRVGAMDYRAVVLPSEAWMLPEAAATLTRFEAAGGIVVRGADCADKVPRTLRITGDGARAIRVLKRVDGAQCIWFLMNEDMSERDVAITLPCPVARFDAETAALEAVATEPGGVLRRTFAPGETALYVTGDGAEGAQPLAPRREETRDIPLLNWTLRPLVSHVAGSEDFGIRPYDAPARPVALGDWRGVLGATFSGKALYRTEFDAPADGEAELDLGDVKWCAAVRLNGADLGARFFGPFRWRVRVAKGRNVLEVTVANLLASQVGDDAIRDRIQRDWPPAGPYDARQRPFDRDNCASGLFGPVSLRRRAPSAQGSGPAS